MDATLAHLQSLEGVFSFPVTPMKPDRSLDLLGFEANLDAICQTDLAAIFVCCGTGEFHALSLAEYRELVTTAKAAIAGRKPLYSGVGMGTAQALEFAHAAQSCGADGVLVLPPYLIAPDPEGLTRYCQAIARSGDLALVLYHRANALFENSTLETLAQEANIVGFKDGHGDMEWLRRLTATFGARFSWMSGMPTAELTFEAFYACGVRSFSSAIANFAPSVGLEFHAAVVRGDSARCTALLREFVLPLADIRDRRAGYAVSYVKCAMNLLGLPAGPVRPPLVDLTSDESAMVAGVLRTNDLLT
jgi:5-dehydro-4-deoxyglucarate dehydratase